MRAGRRAPSSRLETPLAGQRLRVFRSRRLAPRLRRANSKGHFIVEFATPGIGRILKTARRGFVLFDMAVWIAPLHGKVATAFRITRFISTCRCFDFAGGAARGGGQGGWEPSGRGSA
jgi:hypothetical protein